MSKDPNSCPTPFCAGKVELNKFGNRANCFSCGYWVEVPPPEDDEQEENPDDKYPTD